MILPDGFQFSQSSLQDFVDCPRRFYLRYIRQLRFPAAQVEPLREFERQAERGRLFHHLVHQQRVGIPTAALEATIADETVATWWGSYLTNAPADLPTSQHAEIMLSVPLAGKRLAARYDLLAIEPGKRAVIVDWKTGLRRPTREWLAQRLQTVVYPYVLTRAGAHLNGDQPIPPEQITLIYWFAEFPDQPETFTYSAEQFRQDEARLNALAADILRRDADDFELTENTDLCRFCSFRSLNGRGTSAGNLLETDGDSERDDFDIDLHLDQIAEAAF